MIGYFLLDELLTEEERDIRNLQTGSGRALRSRSNRAGRKVLLLVSDLQEG